MCGGGEVRERVQRARERSGGGEQAEDGTYRRATSSVIVVSTPKRGVIPQARACACGSHDCKSKVTNSSTHLTTKRGCGGGVRGRTRRRVGRPSPVAAHCRALPLIVQSLCTTHHLEVVDVALHHLVERLLRHALQRFRGHFCFDAFEEVPCGWIGSGV